MIAMSCMTHVSRVVLVTLVTLMSFVAAAIHGGNGRMSRVIVRSVVMCHVLVAGMIRMRRVIVLRSRHRVLVGMMALVRVLR
jgi:hypothetical protein